MASLVIAYICWLFGGWVGLHHFYLGRDKQAFIWWATFGGLCGAGWFRDLWRLPQYVQEANEDIYRKEWYKDQVRVLAHPPSSTVRFAGSFATSLLLTYITRLSIPEDYIASFVAIKCLSYIAPVVSAAIGSYVVGNIGHERVQFKYCLLGAAIPLPLIPIQVNIITYMALGATISSRYYRQWRLHKGPRRHICIRISRLAICGLIYSSFWVSSIYMNAYVVSNDGVKVPMREAVHNFFKSRAWSEMKETLWQLYELYKVHGFSKLWNEFIEAIDPTGENNAYKVLELHEFGDDLSEQRITQQCRKLSRTWHPDKFKTAEDKEKAQQKFIEIQNACNILSSKKARRQQKNSFREDN